MERFTMLVLLLTPTVCLATGSEADESVDSSTATEIRRAIVASCKAWSSRDIDKIVAENRIRIGGYGFRTKDWRSHESDSREEYAKVLNNWYDTLSSYLVEPIKISVSVHGNTAIAWGTLRESFKRKDGGEENVLIRFTSTYVKDNPTWRELMYHRDIQQFDEDGNYLSHKPEDATAQVE